MKIKNALAFVAAKISLVLVAIYMHAVYRPKAHYVNAKVQKNVFKKPCVIIANHTSLKDPPFLVTVLRGKKSIVCAKDWYEKKKINWIVRNSHAIPIDRYNLDTEWALLAKKELKKGRSVIIFPEGKIRTDGELNEFKSGFAFLARSNNVPVVSIGLDGNYEFGHRVHYVVDEPVAVTRTKGISSSEDLERYCVKFRERVMHLKKCAVDKDFSNL